jgi:hypothetical protein
MTEEADEAVDPAGVSDEDLEPVAGGVDGGPVVPVLVDTGSTGLVVPTQPL